MYPRAARSQIFLTHTQSRAILQECIKRCIPIRMRTTLIIDDDLLERARAVTNIQEKTALVRAGLQAVIAREAGKRLVALRGTQPKLTDVPRRSPDNLHGRLTY